MKKISILFLMITLSIGCAEQQKPNTVDAYKVVMDQLYSQDPALNHDIKYIALDTSSMTNLTDQGKEILLKHLENYGAVVLDMTFEELQEQGYIQDLYFKEGILFRIKDEPMKNNTITMDASKWRSGTGAIGFNKLVIKYKTDGWEIKSLGGSWIS